MIVGVLKETFPSERRVALVPGVVSKLRSMGLDVLVEDGAGANSGFTNTEYVDAGARLMPSRAEVFAMADVLVQVRGPGANPALGRDDLEHFRTGQVLLGFLNPLGNPHAVLELAATGVTALALELIPRISRAQSMDALSSMAMVAGYKSVLLAANVLPRMFPMMMTAAGTLTPAHVFVVGAGVAGLQAIATARRLGAVVEAYDIRSSARGDVESLGGRFVDLSFKALEMASEAEEGGEGSGGYAKAMDEEFYRHQREGMAEVVASNDVIITTAAVPGRKAPILVTGEMVHRMKPGSVIVDLAAEAGGNCELTIPGETVEIDGVTIIGPVDLPSAVPYHSSQLFANNVTEFLRYLIKDGEFNLDLEEPVIGETMVAHLGEVFNLKVRELLDLPAIDLAKDPEPGILRTKDHQPENDGGET